MTDHDGRSEAPRRRFSAAAPTAAIEGCSLAILAGALVADARVGGGAAASYGALFVLALALILVKRVRGEYSVPAIPVIVMYAFTRFGAAAPMRVPGGGAVLVPATVVILAVMVLAWVGALLARGETDVFRRDPVIAFTGAILFAVLSGFLLQRAACRMYRCGWSEWTGGAGNAIALGMIFIVLTDHLSRRGTLRRYLAYVAAFTALGAFVSAIR